MLKRGLSKIVPLIAVLLAAAGLVAPVNAAVDKTVTIHYQRVEGDYAGWNLWLWPLSKEGAAYQFQGDDAYGKVGTFTIPASADVAQIGFIVRLNNWEAKDVGPDRFITQFDQDGKAEIWLVGNDPTIYYSEPVIVPTIMSASIDSLNSISVSLNNRFGPITANAANGFTLEGPGNLTITNTVGKNNASFASSLTLTTSANLALDGEYVLKHPNYPDKPVQLGKVLNSDAFNQLFTYTGDDLGNVYSKAKTDFRVWAPTATAVRLNIYPDDSLASSPDVINMTKSVNGTWTHTLQGDQDGTIYTYSAYVGGIWREAVDPYVRAATINGVRGVVVDLASTDPAGFRSHSAPAFSGRPTDAVFYELHVRDLSVDASSNIAEQYKGKFLGLTQAGTKTTDGKSKTGVDAIVDLGVTHLQLLPIYDYKTVDESRNDQFNWGYDPLNYNVVEGSYSTQPANPKNRITELKQTIQYLHSRKLRVVMDVVYNHVFDAASHSFEKLVPGYYFRKEANGNFANGTGVGNETASERPMVRKFIVDSTKYWASEFKLDGYRFDLMGIHDVTTMQQVRAAMTAIDPKFLVIGEGWVMGNQLPAAEKAAQPNASKLKGVGMFNDTIRDGLKGSVFQKVDTGWASGKFSAKPSVQAGVVGNTLYGSVGGNWGQIAPGQSVNYVEAHDNLTLFDKLAASMPSASAKERANVFRLASSVAILAQGLPFIHAGQEFMRSKGGDENSYKSPDSVNSMKWNERVTNASMVNYFKGLIALRKAHPAFRLSTAAGIKSRLKFITAPQSVVAYRLDGKGAGDSWKNIVVVHNAAKKAATINLPAKGNWKLVVDTTRAGVKTLKTFKMVNKVSVPAQSTFVLYL